MPQWEDRERDKIEKVVYGSGRGDMGECGWERRDTAMEEHDYERRVGAIMEKRREEWKWL